MTEFERDLLRERIIDKLIVWIGRRHIIVRSNFKRSFCVIAITLVGIIFSHPMTAQGQLYAPDNKSDILEWQIGLRWGGIIGRQDKAFSNIPVSYRTVPWHPDDDYSHSLCTVIPDSNLNPSAIISSNYEFLTGFRIKKRLALRGGIGFFIAGGNNGDYQPGNTGVIREIDIYSGTFQRGYGTSLVYYAIKRKNWTGWNPYILFEGEVKIADIQNDNILLRFGGWRKSYNYVIERGWDRFDELQTLEQIPLAKMELTYYYTGISYVLEEGPISCGFSFTIAQTNSKVSFEPQAQGAKVQGNRGLIFGLAVVIGGTIKKW